MDVRLSQSDKKDAETELHLVDAHLKVKAGHYTKLQGHRAPNLRIYTMFSSGKWDSPGVGTLCGSWSDSRFR